MNKIEESKIPGSGLQYVHAWHYDMLVNQERSQFYSDLIRENCRDKVVLEIGTGSGLLAVLAVKHGAKKVICCEENPMLAMAAAQLFKRLHLEDRIQLIGKNSKEILTEEFPPIDVILHELFGSDPFSEEVLPTLRDAQRFLKPGGIFLPEKMQIIYQPVRSYGLPQALFFEDIVLEEMGHLLSQVHPALRDRNLKDAAEEVFRLPAISFHQLLKNPYSYTERNDKLTDVDAIEVSFVILHGTHELQAAKFETPGGRVHWQPMVFYKLDISSNQLVFALKEQVQLTVL